MLTINIMTAGLRPGDAIGNYIMSAARILREWGARVRLYADYIDPAYARVVAHSSLYQPTGDEILWFHFSIYADNVARALASPDFKIMDFHGITPPALFAGLDDHLAMLCQQGYDLLPQMAKSFDYYICHTEYVRDWLHGLGVLDDRLQKIFYCVDTSDFLKARDDELTALLGKLDYLLFVGRMVPQKDILAMLEVFSRVHTSRSEMVLMLVGSRDLVPRYQRQIDALIKEKGLEKRVLFTGQVNNPAVLRALFEQSTLGIIVSEWESFCVPIAESAFFGVPVVVDDEPPLPEVAGPAGLVIDKHAPDAAARQIVNLLSNPVRFEQQKIAARDWATQYTDEALAVNIRAMFTRWLDEQITARR